MTRSFLQPTAVTVSLATALALALVAPAGAQTPKASPAPKAAPSKPAGTGGYDATNPQALSGLLTSAGATVAATRREGDSVFLSITSPAANFSVQFAGCNANGRACQAVLFDSLVNLGKPTLAQINDFNQTSVACRMHQDRQGRPHVTYAALLLGSDTEASGQTHLAAWQGCLADAAIFSRDPTGYLAIAP
jgi:hypothetical protein